MRGVEWMGWGWRRRAVAAALVCVGALLISSAPLTGQTEPGTPVDLRQFAPGERFDFLVGDWSYAFASGEGTAGYVPARDGTAIRESVEGTFNGTRFSGASLIWWDPQAQVWRQRWVDTLGTVLAGEITLRPYAESEVPALVAQLELDGALFRHVWYDITPDRFETDLLVSQDGGESWQLTRRMPYLRIR